MASEALERLLSSKMISKVLKVSLELSTKKDFTAPAVAREDNQGMIVKVWNLQKTFH